MPQDDTPTRSGRIGEASTDISLRDYMEARLRSERLLTSQQFDALKEATDKVAGATSERFKSVNEFRAQLSDQQKTFITRAEYDASHVDLARRIDLNTDQINELRRTGANLSGRIATVGGAFAVIVIAIQIAIALLVK